MTSEPSIAGLAIRPATEDDLETLGRLGASLMSDHFAFDQLRFMTPRVDSEAGYAWFLASELRAPDVVVLVADARGEVVGYVYAGLEPLSWRELREEAGFIHDIVVEPGSRRSGVATALVAAAEAWLRSRGAPRVMLWTAEQNVPAHRLFARLGFRRTMIEMTKEL